MNDNMLGVYKKTKKDLGLKLSQINELLDSYHSKHSDIDMYIYIIMKFMYRSEKKEKLD
jgi:hypothetical protein